MNPPTDDPVALWDAPVPQSDDEFLAADARVRDGLGQIGQLWLQVALDLRQIRVGGALERNGYSSFTEYLQSVRGQISARHARRLMSAAEMIVEAVGAPPLPDRLPGRPGPLTGPTGPVLPPLRPIVLPPTVTERAVRATVARYGRDDAVVHLREHLADPSVPLVPDAEGWTPVVPAPEPEDATAQCPYCHGSGRVPVGPQARR